MFQGTASDVGKSLVTAAFCRALTNRGHSVRPFKPQNMSNNAAVTADGGEIGRAQALQAKACRVDPHVDMNPVLLKPQSDVGSQVVVRGEVKGNYSAREFQDIKPDLLDDVIAAFDRLGEDADFVVAEGAGSAAEINLRRNDIANMGFALAAGVNVVLIGDIDRGGVIANIVGTKVLLDPAEDALIAGFIINRFRGDPSLFDGGLTMIAGRTGYRSFGVLPYLTAARHLPQEDAMSLENREGGPIGGTIRIAVPRLAHISNFDDFDPLIAEPDVDLVMVPPGEALPGDAHLVILPGSKATIADLAHLREQGWDIDLAAHVRRGGQVMGICGGYQILGRRIADPDGMEGPAGSTDGLGYLDVETRLTGGKTLTEVSGADARGTPVAGYEMHVGETSGPATVIPYLTLGGRADGAVSEDGRIAGCYVHGLVAADEFRHSFLKRLEERSASGLRYEASVEAALDDIAEALESNLDVDGLMDAAG